MAFIASIKIKKINHRIGNNRFDRDFANFARIVGKTKKLRRTGWKAKAKIEFGETIAEHMYRVAVLAMVMSDKKKFDTEKVLKMSLLHDLTEVITGDLTPKEKIKIGIRKSFRKEEEALKSIFINVPKGIKENYLELWKEINLGNTEEAKLVKSIDKLEMAIQAIEYIDEGYDKNKLEQFIKSAMNDIKDKELLKILKNFS